MKIVTLEKEQAMCDLSGSKVVRWTCRAMTVVSLFSLLANSAVRAEDKPQLPDHLVVLRISDDVLRSMIDTKDVDRVAEIHDNILGTSLHGQAHVVGKPSVQLTKNEDKATFYITLQGEARSATTGYNGPAIIHSRGVTKFTASKQVVFEPGKGFYALPAQVSAQTQAVITGIDSTRGGIIGNIVRRRAGRIAAEQQPQVTEIARQRAERRIAAAFDKSSEERLANLNASADFRTLATLATRANGNVEPKYVCCTTPHYLQIAAKFGDGTSPIDLPVHNSANPRGAPIELWVHESLISDRVVAGIEMLTTRVESSDLLRTVAAAAQLFAGRSEELSSLASVPANQNFQIHKVSDWRKVEMQMPSKEFAAMAKTVAQIATAQPAPKQSREANQVAVARRPLTSTRPLTPTFSPEYRGEGVQRVLKPVNLPTVSVVKARIWTSGTHTAHAEFLALDGNVVRLRRVSGVNTRIALAKLSETDQAWIQNHLAGR